MRWKKGQIGLEPDADKASPLKGGYREGAPSAVELGDPDGQYTGGLFNLLMGELSQMVDC